MSDAAAGTKKIAIKTRKVKKDEKLQTYKVSCSYRNKQTIRKKKKRGAISSHLDETGSFNNFTFS